MMCIKLNVLYYERENFTHQEVGTFEIRHTNVEAMTRAPSCALGLVQDSPFWTCMTKM